MKDSGGTTIYSIGWTYDNVGNRATQTKDGNQTSYTYHAFPQHGQRLWSRLRRGQPSPAQAPLAG